MLLAADTRHSSRHVEGVLEDVEMTPGSLAMIVFGHHPIAQRASAFVLVLDERLDSTTLQFELRAGHPPGRLKSKKTAQKIQVLHTQTLRRFPKIIYLSNRNSCSAEFSLCPPDEKDIDPTQRRIQRRLVEVSVVGDPAADIRIEHPSQIIEHLVAPGL